MILTNLRSMVSQLKSQKENGIRAVGIRNIIVRLEAIFKSFWAKTNLLGQT